MRTIYAYLFITILSKTNHGAPTEDFEADQILTYKGDIADFSSFGSKVKIQFLQDEESAATHVTPGSLVVKSYASFFISSFICLVISS